MLMTGSIPLPIIENRFLNTTNVLLITFQSDE